MTKTETGLFPLAWIQEIDEGPDPPETITWGEFTDLYLEQRAIIRQHNQDKRRLLSWRNKNSSEHARSVSEP